MFLKSPNDESTVFDLIKAVAIGVKFSLDTLYVSSNIFDKLIPRAQVLDVCLNDHYKNNIKSFTQFMN